MVWTAHLLKMMDVREGLSKFMQRTGLSLSEEQLAVFRRKFRSIMSYDPNVKIDQFIRDSVLEKKKVDFSKLVEAKNNIDTLTANFAIIDAELKELEEVIELFDELQRARNSILADDVKLAYKSFLKYDRIIKDASRNMEIAKRRLAVAKYFEDIQIEVSKMNCWTKSCWISTLQKSHKSFALGGS